MASKEPKIVTSRLIAAVAFALLTFAFARNIRNLQAPVPEFYDWKLLNWPSSPTWFLAGLNVLFYAWFAYLVVAAFREFERSDERLLLFWFGGGLLHPLPALWPSLLSVKPYLNLALAMCSWMAAISLLLYNFKRVSCGTSGAELPNDQRPTTND